MASARRQRRHHRDQGRQQKPERARLGHLLKELLSLGIEERGRKLAMPHWEPLLERKQHLTARADQLGRIANKGFLGLGVQVSAIAVGAR